MKTCPSCGLIAPSSTDRCERCGQSLTGESSGGASFNDAIMRTVAADIRVIRNAAIVWMALTIVGLAIAIIWGVSFADRYERYRTLLDTPPSTQKARP